MPSKIEWTDETWNPITGCSPISEGCAHCYAKRMATRLRGRHGYDKDEPFKVTVHKDKIMQPYHWKKPRRIFVCSMGDLFHEDVSARFIDDVYFGMRGNTRHTFMLLTKRPEHMRHYVETWFMHGEFSNIWLGVTAENQKCADERIPILLDIPAAVRFVSVEPMLRRVDLRWYLRPRKYQIDQPKIPALNWVICGAETGPGKRPMNLGWARDLRDQCIREDVPFFFKKDSGGNHELDGKIWEEFPDATKT